MNVYGHVTLDEKREALDKLGTLFEQEKRPGCSNRRQRPHARRNAVDPRRTKAQVNGGYDLGFRKRA